MFGSGEKQKWDDGNEEKGRYLLINIIFCKMINWDNFFHYR